MTAFALVLSFVGFSSTAQAAFESLFVQRADPETIIVRRPNNEVWTLELGPGCEDIPTYQGRYVRGDYDVSPSDAGARIQIPATGASCRILSADQN